MQAQSFVDESDTLNEVQRDMEEEKLTSYIKNERLVHDIPELMKSVLQQTNWNAYPALRGKEFSVRISAESDVEVEVK